MNEEHVEAEIVPPGPCVMVIFGASGDLTKRLLMPALYNLATNKLLPENFAVVGVAIDAMDTAGFRDQLMRGVQETAQGEIVPELWNTAFSERLQYVQGESENPETYQQLKTMLADIDRDQKTLGNVLFYLAVPPSFFGKIIQQLAAAELTTQTADPNDGIGWRRVVIEKPFGGSMRLAKSKEITSLVIASHQTWHRNPARRPTQRSSCRLTIGGGLTCRFTSAPADACRSAFRKLSSSLSRLPFCRTEADELLHRDGRHWHRL